jgi:hypothetical protein
LMGIPKGRFPPSGLGILPSYRQRFIRALEEFLPYAGPMLVKLFFFAASEVDFAFDIRPNNV